MQAAQAGSSSELEAAREAVAGDPESPEAHKALARLAMVLHLEPEAVRAAALAAALDPSDDDAKALLAKTYLRNGEYDAGLEILSSLPSTDAERYELQPAAEAARLALNADREIEVASRSDGAGDFASPVDLLQRAARADPDNLAVQKTLAWVYLEKVHDARRAYPYARKLARHRPDELDAAKLLAWAATESGRFKQSLELLGDILNQDPFDQWMRVNLARTYAGLGRRREAMQLYQDILRDDPTNAAAKQGLSEASGDPVAGSGGTKESRWLMQLADLHIREGDRSGSRAAYQKAVEVLLEAARSAPEDADIQEKLGWLYVEKLQDHCRAYPHLRRALALRPGDLGTLKLLALAQAGLGRHRQAISTFQDVLRRDPDDRWMQVNLGMSLARLEYFEEALAIYDRVLRAEPRNAGARLGVAEVLAWQGQTDRPAAICRELIAEDPNNVAARLLLGDLYRWDWALTPASTQYLRALNIDPRSRAARDGLLAIDRLADPRFNFDVYQFVDNFEFDRFYQAYSVRAPLTDRAYLSVGVYDWQFEQEFVRETRFDERVEFEYHFARELESRIRLLNFDYNNHEPEQGLALSSTWTPLPDFDIHLLYAWNEPAHLTSLNVALDNLRMDIFEIAVDVPVYGQLSGQAQYSDALYSDDNQRWFSSAQLSYESCRWPDNFLRLEYERLAFAEQRETYFSPDEFEILRPMLDLSCPIGHHVRMLARPELPYVVEQQEWGHGITAGPKLEFQRLEVTGLYTNISIPAAAPFSGQGFQITGSLRF